MAGRRLRTAVAEAVAPLVPGEDVYVSIAGLSNSYSSYVTTYEEYQAQRYEAASTLFGPHTLSAYLQEFNRLAKDMVTGSPSVSGPAPPDLSSEQISLHVRKFPFDRTPLGTRFGDVVEGYDVLPSYTAGSTASAKFHSANPRNNQRLQGTFLTVEKKTRLGRWEVVAVDGDWETKFHWMAGKDDPLDVGLSGLSEATIYWDIPENTSGTFRLCHFGDRRLPHDHDPVPFTGCSSEFEVV